MKIRTQDLTGADLNWAVAKCEGIRVIRCDAGKNQYLAYVPKRSAYKKYSPSTNWIQGGPIIEREEIHILRAYTPPEWVASIAYSPKDGKQLVGGRRVASAPTPLVAAMRCYVVSKLGDEIDVPKELT